MKKSFNSLDQLPDEVRQLPNLAQLAWMNSFNSFESLGDTIESASAQAWDEIKQVWEFDEEQNVWSSKSLCTGDICMQTIVNRTTDKGNFKTWIPLAYENGKLKIIEKEIKDNDGNSVKRKFLQGVASNTEIDKEFERVSPTFIKRMQDTALGLNVFLEHDHTLEKTVGVVSGSGGDESNFWAETMLEPESDNDNVKSILQKSSNGIRLGYSIGGRATEISKGKDENSGKEFISLDNGDLFELSVTPMPAGNGTWVTPIVKCAKKLISEYEDEELKKQKSTLKSNSDVFKKDKVKFVKDLSVLLASDFNQTELSKALQEMIQADEINGQMFDLWWAFRDAIRFITFNEDLSSDQKSEKIMQFAEDFASRIMELTSTLSELVQNIDEALTS